MMKLVFATLLARSADLLALKDLNYYHELTTWKHHSGLNSQVSQTWKSLGLFSEHMAVKPKEKASGVRNELFETRERMHAKRLFKELGYSLRAKYIHYHR